MVTGRFRTYLGTYLTVLGDGDEAHFAEQELLRETI